MKIFFPLKYPVLAPILLMVFSSVFIAVAQSFFKIASTTTNPLLLNYTSFFLGVFIYFSAFFTSTIAYKYGHLSVLFPLTSISIAINLVLSHVLFAEPITFRQIAGTIVIIIGVLFTAKEI